MTREFVLDCSATLTWVFADEANPACDALLRDLEAGARAAVPSLWHLELANVLAGALRRGRIDQAGVEAFLGLLGAYAIHVDARTSERAWSKTLDLAVQHGLSTYDAAYLELALRLDLPLATLDADLVRAATAAGVPLLVPRRRQAGKR